MAQTLSGNEIFDINNGKIIYPGASDMKGGLVTLFFALKILEELNLLPNNIRIILSSDEEIGSPFSRRYITNSARNSSVCLSLEPARANGAIVNARKGGTYFTLTIKGRSAHSGVEPEKGISAAEELAYKVIELHKLTNLDEGITVNVGYLNAGTSLGNAIAGHGCAKIDVKYWTPEQGKRVIDKIKKICSQSSVPGTIITLEQHPGFEPMEYLPESKRLNDLMIKNGEKLGLQIESGIPTICGMGPVGGLLHSPQEYIEIESLWERTALLALTILSLNERFIDYK